MLRGGTDRASLPFAVLMQTKRRGNLHFFEGTPTGIRSEGTPVRSLDRRLLPWAERRNVGTTVAQPWTPASPRRPAACALRAWRRRSGAAAQRRTFRSFLLGKNPATSVFWPLTFPVLNISCKHEKITKGEGGCVRAERNRPAAWARRKRRKGARMRCSQLHSWAAFTGPSRA